MAVEAEQQGQDADTETRSRILSAAFGLFMEKGYAGVSTLEIATRAKVSKRDLYALVGNKQAIFQACVATRSSRMAAPGAGPPPATGAELAAALTRFGEGLLRELLHPAVIGVHRLVIAEGDRSPELGVEMARVRRSNEAAVGRLIGDAQGRGLVVGGDTDAMAEQFLDLLGGSRMLLSVLAGGEAPTPGDQARRAADAAAAFVDLHGA